MDLKKIEQSEEIHRNRAIKQESHEMPLLMCSDIYRLLSWNSIWRTLFVFTSLCLLYLLLNFYLEWSLSTLLLCLAAAQMWTQSLISLFRGPDMCAELRNDFQINMNERFLSIDGQRQCFVAIYLVVNNIVEFFASVTEFKTGLIQMLSNLGALLVLCTALNAVGDKFLLWTATFLAFVVPVLMFRRRKNDERPSNESELTDLGMKVAGVFGNLLSNVKIPSYENEFVLMSK